MDDITISFLIAITVLLIASLMIIGKARVRYLDSLWFYLVNDDQKAPSADIPSLCYLPLLLTSAVEIAWVVCYWPECYVSLDRITPSFSDSNWIWTAIMCFVVPLPCGAQAFLVYKQFDSVEPDTEILKYPFIIVSIAGLACLVFAMQKVYPLWFIWWPIVSGSVYCYVLWPRTDKEKAYDEEKRREREESLASTSYHSSSPSYSQPRSRNTSSRQESGSSSTRNDRSDEMRADAIRQTAENYLYQARQYEDEARRLESEAESNDRSAEDNEYWARETDDSFKRSEAQADRNRARSLRYQANKARDRASHYYSLYQSEMSKLR